MFSGLKTLGNTIQEYPLRATCWGYAFTHVKGGTALYLSVNTNAAWLHYGEGINQNFGALFVHPICLAKGTYTLNGVFFTATNRVIHDWYLDGQWIGAMDTYGASTHNVLKAVTNVIVPESGWHQLAFVFLRKNASSSATTNFDVDFIKAWLYPQNGDENP